MCALIHPGNVDILLQVLMLNLGPDLVLMMPGIYISALYSPFSRYDVFIIIISLDLAQFQFCLSSDYSVLMW